MSKSDKEKIAALSFAIVITIMLALMLVIQVARVVLPPPEIEYTVQFVPDSVAQTILDKVADNGWDIVSARRATDGKGGIGYELLVRRNKIK